MQSHDKGKEIFLAAEFWLAQRREFDAGVLFTGLFTCKALLYFTHKNVWMSRQLVALDCASQKLPSECFPLA